MSPKTGEVLFDTDHMLMPNDAKVLAEHGIEEVKIRSVMTCEARSASAPSATASTWPSVSLWAPARR